MPYVPFYSLFPDIAQRETRSVMLFQTSDAGLPPGDYGFIEMFCDETGCDCRRVFLYVMSEGRRDVEAVIAYGWESLEFYRRWMGNDDPHVLSQLKGPILNPGSPESDIAAAILDMFQKALLPDRAYIDRVKRHYGMFRARIDRSRKRDRFLARKATGRLSR